MKQLLSIAAFFAVLAFGSFAFAQEGQQGGQPSKAELIKQYAKGAAGVKDFDFDEEGHLIKAVVVGKAVISSVAGPRGELIAERKAAIDCRAQFVQWCKEKMTVDESDEDELIEKQNASENGTETESKDSTYYSRKVESKAASMVQGMTEIYSGINAEKRQYVIIKVFDRKLANRLRDLGQELNEDADSSGKTNENIQPARKPANGSLKDEHHVSPNLNKLW